MPRITYTTTVDLADDYSLILVKDINNILTASTQVLHALPGVLAAATVQTADLALPAAAASDDALQALAARVQALEAHSLSTEEATAVFAARCDEHIAEHLSTDTADAKLEQLIEAYFDTHLDLEAIVSRRLKESGSITEEIVERFVKAEVEVYDVGGMIRKVIKDADLYVNFTI